MQDLSHVGSGRGELIAASRGAVVCVDGGFDEDKEDALESVTLFFDLAFVGEGVNEEGGDKIVSVVAAVISFFLGAVVFFARGGRIDASAVVVAVFTNACTFFFGESFFVATPRVDKFNPLNKCDLNVVDPLLTNISF